MFVSLRAQLHPELAIGFGLLTLPVNTITSSRRKQYVEEKKRRGEVVPLLKSRGPRVAGEGLQRIPF